MLVEVGRGNFSVDAFGELLSSRSNVSAKFTAPPSGLFLEKVLYRGDSPPNTIEAIMPLPDRSDYADHGRAKTDSRK